VAREGGRLQSPVTIAQAMVAQVDSIHSHNPETLIMGVSNITSASNAAAKDAISQAKAEIAAEALRKGVEKFKIKLREQAAAQLVLSNVNREIEELQLQLEQAAAQLVLSNVNREIEELQLQLEQGAV
jgi:hypothetical protein